MARGETDGIDPSAIREAIERALGAMGDVLRIKQQLTGAKTSIDKGSEILDAMATAVRAQLTQVELLLAAADEALEAQPAAAAVEPPPAAPAAEASSPAEGAAEPPSPAEADQAPPRNAAPRPAATAAARAAKPLPAPYPGAEQLPF